MTTEAILTEALNAVFLSLTPIERWQAARRFNTSFVFEHWFVITAMAALALLIVLFLWVSYKRITEARRIADQQFFESAQRKGLTPRERHLLLEIVKRSGSKHRNAIFTTQDAFNGGAGKLLEESLASQQSPEETDQLKVELSFLREKLSFQPPRSTGSPNTSRKLSSRQIPMGKTIHVTRRKVRRSTSIEAIVLRNTDAELVVKLATPVQSRSGEYWDVRYYFGASVLEFETSVIKCAGDILVLNHSDDVRFTNRRRIRRVPINKPALIAHFPFVRTVPQQIKRSKSSSKTKRASAQKRPWAAPEFVPGVVTELAGPGLQIEAPLQAKTGDRLLVMFELNAQDGQKAASKESPKKPPSKIVQGIGMVRHTKSKKNSVSIAVELMGLSEENTDQLIRATDSASTRGGPKGKDRLPSAGNKQVAEQELVESVAG